MNGRIFRRLVGGIGVLCLIAATGCGGSGDSSAPTKEAFVREANGVCAKGQQERDRIITKRYVAVKGKELNQSEQEEFILEIIPVYAAEAQKVGELTPPQGGEQKVEAIVKAMEEAAERAEADPNSAIGTDLLFRKANKLVEASGLDKCIS